MKNYIFQTLLALFMLAPAFSQKTLDIYLDTDAYTNSDYPTTNYGNSVIRIENMTPSLLSYLFMPSNVIPSNLKIAKAELFLYNVVKSGSNQVVFNKVTSTWNETSITHNVSPTVTTTGQKSATISSSIVSVDITNWVQEWYANPSLNYGLRIGAGSATAKQTYIFHSSESNVDASLKPYVRITYYENLEINWTNITNGFLITGNTIWTTYGSGTANSFNVLLPNFTGLLSFKPEVSSINPTTLIGLSDPADPTTMLYGMSIMKDGTSNVISILVNGNVLNTYQVSGGSLCSIERDWDNIYFTIGSDKYTYAGNYINRGKRLVVYASLNASITIKDVFCSFSGKYTPPKTSYSYTPSKTSTKNYIFATTPRTPVSSVTTGSRSTTSYNDDIQYFDGLGRLVESNSLLASPSGKDIISLIGYDNLGRLDLNYLPYTHAANGAYLGGGGGSETNQFIFYSAGNTNGVASESASYLKIKNNFDQSPLNRLVSTISQGAAWSTKPVSYGYATNTANTIIRWKLNDYGLPITELGKNFYDASSLYVNQTTDEDGRVVKEYKDKQGQVIMKDAAGLQTYYVYDGLGLLRCVIPPKALAQKSTAANGTYYFVADATKDPLNELLYKYTYDSRQRMISKKIPGADEVRMVYDARDRLVLVQDGKLRAENSYKWMFTKYDQLNRPVLTGIVTISGKTADSLRIRFANEKTRLYETPSPTSNTLHTLNNSYPSGLVTIVEADVYTITYYDSYPSNTSALAYTRLTTDYDATYSTLTKNKVTTTKVRAVVDAATGFALTNSFTATNYYYDKYGRGIGSTSLNYIGLTTKSNTKYDFTNSVLQTREQLLNSAGYVEIVSVSHRFVYDHRNRLLETYHKVNNDTEVLLAQNNYNELGQLIEKHNGLTNKYVGFLQHTDYAYNIRGWLKKINNSALSDGEGDLFGMELYYESTAIPGSTAQYNGNISNMVWKNKTNTNPKSYRYSYDNLNRLKSANYAEGTSFNLNTDYNNESYTYDANGNINTLTRIQNNIRIDTLAYNYLKLGNKLQYIVDLAPAASKASGFNDRNTANTIDYEYDANGNIKKDLNKLMAISSNYLNLPSKISSTTTGVTDKIEYLYNAQGAKLAKKVNGLAEEEHYMGNLVIKKSGTTFTVNYLLHSEGLVTKTTTAYVYEYFAKDHLGNTRVKYKDVNGVATVQQATDYYPFGLAFTPITPNDGNKYLYNGKELQDNAIGGVNLDWYDYGARMYDPALGRWHTTDPLEQYMSPYVYVGNNPINRYDPNGMSDQTTIIDPFGKIIYHKDDDDKNIYQSPDGEKGKDGNTDGLEDVGDEKSGVYYRVGDFIHWHANLINGRYTFDHSVESWPYGFDPMAAKGQALQPSIIDDVIEIIFTGGGSVLVKKGGKWILKEATEEVLEEIAEEAAETGAKVVYRVFGGEAKALGGSWTPINPNSVVNYRNAAGLFEGNTGRFVIEGTVNNADIILQRGALPSPGNSGGLLEYVIDPAKVNINRVSGVNPQF